MDVVKVEAELVSVEGPGLIRVGDGHLADKWRGWRCEDPPYHAPVFVLNEARQAAGSKDVAVAGGAQTVRQFLSAGLIDELRLHIAPIVLGAGERLLGGVAGLKFEPPEVGGTSLVTHVRYRVLR